MFCHSIPSLDGVKQQNLGFNQNYSFILFILFNQLTDLYHCLSNKTAVLAIYMTCLPNTAILVQNSIGTSIGLAFHHLHSPMCREVPSCIPLLWCASSHLLLMAIVACFFQWLWAWGCPSRHISGEIPSRPPAKHFSIIFLKCLRNLIKSAHSTVS